MVWSHRIRVESLSICSSCFHLLLAPALQRGPDSFVLFLVLEQKLCVVESNKASGLVIKKSISAMYALLPKQCQNSSGVLCCLLLLFLCAFPVFLVICTFNWYSFPCYFPIGFFILGLLCLRLRLFGCKIFPVKCFSFSIVWLKKKSAKNILHVKHSPSHGRKCFPPKNPVSHFWDSCLSLPHAPMGPTLSQTNVP